MCNFQESHNHIALNNNKEKKHTKQNKKIGQATIHPKCLLHIELNGTAKQGQRRVSRQVLSFQLIVQEKFHVDFIPPNEMCNTKTYSKSSPILHVKYVVVKISLSKVRDECYSNACAVYLCFIFVQPRDICSLQL